MQPGHYPAVMKFIVCKAIAPLLAGIAAALITLKVASVIGTLIGVFTTVAGVVKNVVFAFRQ